MENWIMNWKQKIVLIVSMLVFVWIGINPPRYHWTTSNDKIPMGAGRYTVPGGSRTDTGKLAGYWCSDIVATGVLIYLLKSTKKTDQ
jgi:hypothetical protein